LTMPFRFRASLRIAPGVRLNLGRRALFSFRRSIRIVPGVRLNLGKRGLSTSLGGRGARVTVRRNTRATASAPGAAGPVVTVVIWGARLLSGAVMIALLFSWAAGWL
jgi:hypothetical protein